MNTVAAPASFWQEAQVAELNYWQERKRWCEGVFGMLDYLQYLAMSLDFASESLRRLESPNCLEIGVGPFGIGSLIFHLADRGRVDGLEPLPPLEIQCQDECLNAYVRHLKARVTYHQLPAENTGFGAATYDVVGCHNVIDHCADPDQIINEAHRVLKPGGWFILSLNVFSTIGRWKFELGRRVKPRQDLYVEHPWSYTPDGIERKVCAHGFRVQQRAGLRQHLLSRSTLTKFVFVKM